ncbi:MAG: hypothetical protein K6G27_07215 [Lachnospiraceae bacterium]|nr:hypothetical protein [Lachnospiraceae bacterium]
MRIGSQGQGYSLYNSLYVQSAGSGRGTAVGSMNNSQANMGNTTNTGWNIGTAKVDANAKESVRKQMQDQLRNLFEKEKANSGGMSLMSGADNSVNGTEDSDETKEDKLLNSGKIYNFKEISNKIMRAKTPASAGQAVVAAKRKISEIKRKLASSDGDSNDLQLALTHARKMEVVAERKKNNLTLEELVTNTQKRDELFKKKEEREASGSMTIDAYEQMKDEVLDKQLKLIEDNEKAMREEMAKKQQELEKEVARKQAEAVREDMQEQMGAFLDEMDDEQSEMLREMSEMLDAVEIVDPHMNEQELDKLKLKHRLSENKAIMKADMDYLKGMMPSHSAGSVPVAMAGGMAGTGPAGGALGAMGGLVSASAGMTAPASDGAAGVTIQ